MLTQIFNHWALCFTAKKHCTTIWVESMSDHMADFLGCCFFCPYLELEVEVFLWESTTKLRSTQSIAHPEVCFPFGSRCRFFGPTSSTTLWISLSLSLHWELAKPPGNFCCQSNIITGQMGEKPPNNCLDFSTSWIWKLTVTIFLFPTCSRDLKPSWIMTP